MYFKAFSGFPASTWPEPIQKVKNVIRSRKKVLKTSVFYVAPYAAFGFYLLKISIFGHYITKSTTMKKLVLIAAAFLMMLPTAFAQKGLHAGLKVTPMTTWMFNKEFSDAGDG